MHFFPFAFLSTCSLPYQAKVFICLGDQDLLQKEFKEKKSTNIPLLHAIQDYVAGKTIIVRKNVPYSFNSPLEYQNPSMEDSSHTFSYGVGKTPLYLQQLSLCCSRRLRQDIRSKSHHFLVKEIVGRRKGEEGRQGPVCSLQASSRKGCILEKRGGQLCPLLPIRRLAPRLCLTNLGCNHISANVAGQCGQAERGSEISLPNHPQFLVAGMLS